MAYDQNIENQILEADDMVETTIYESAGRGYQSIENVDLLQDQYKNKKRIMKIEYSSVIIGYKVLYMYVYMYPRDSKKYGAVRNIIKETTIL